MEYLKVRWFHQYSDEPIELYSELDENRNETRKVEIFLNGDLGFASPKTSKGTTQLSLVPFPKNSEIAADPQFEITEISLAAFEQIWLKSLNT